MRQDVACLGLVLVAAACSSSNSVSRPEETCEAVQVRLVELELPLGTSDRDNRAEVMRRALGREFVEHCTRSISRAQADCVLLASDSRTAHKCLANSSTPTAPAKESL